MITVREVEKARSNVRKTRDAAEVTITAFYAERKAKGGLCGEALVEMNDALNAYTAADTEYNRLRVAYERDRVLPVRSMEDVL